MTTQPHIQPAAGPTPDPAAVARALDERIVRSTEVLAAHITAATLDAVGRPSKLPEALWPDADQDLVRQIWDLALAVGYLGGKRAVEGSRWEHERLAAARDQLADAGYAAMAERIARVLPPPGAEEHPADGEARLASVRGDRS
ncbi:hypothetical protein [Streptomyces sp. ME19-01-6]|uniref:hypothetical protein n=1 Tax=Streptomyces sp. ME19-01-6 TaxID=3028686 RepID=UPI0029BCA352|nr:hypothetical protein [Streptomyces sp. ME19-01-6]MDX3232924.1 hypothetical protein [Streptomyces sp. ME19-01-6]